MNRVWLRLGLLLLVLALPFAARSRPGARRGQGPAAATPASGVETLVVLTPHNEAVRHEFGRAFATFMAQRGRRVSIDWRTPGGTAEISRYLASEYTAAFARYWTASGGRGWSGRIAAGFMSPSRASPRPQAPLPAEDEVAAARREFLQSNVGCGVDLLFGGGSSEHIKHADAGRLVDAGVVARHPELFGAGGIPQTVGRQAYWDPAGRWMGTCLSSFGICFNRDVLRRLNVPVPSSWADLADVRLHGQLALSDPTKSGSIARTFEVLVQARMQRAAAAERGGSAGSRPTAAAEGWAEALRLVRRIGGNARYFTDAASKIPLDVANGDAAAGMCIDYYGRFQSEALAAVGHPERIGFIAPRGESATDPDPVALLRGAPHRALAVAFIEFVLSEAGQKLWAFRRGTPGGPERYTLRRLPILPAIYRPDWIQYRGDPDEDPYAKPHPEWHAAPADGAPLGGALAFVIRAMCVDTESELQTAYAALAAGGFPAQASAAFDDMTLVDYLTVTGPIRAALQATDPLGEADWARRLARQFQAVYGRTTMLARQGR